MRTSVPDERREYVVNPIATAFHDDRYYLLCYNDRHMTLSQYRVDRMENVKKLDEDITPNPELKAVQIAHHKKSLFDMYGGKKEEIVFETEVSVLDAIYDKFGESVNIMSLGDNKARCRVEVQIGRPLLMWFIGFGSSLKVLSPSDVILQLKELIEEARDNYI